MAIKVHAPSLCCKRTHSSGSSVQHRPEDVACALDCVDGTVCSSRGRLVTSLLPFPFIRLSAVTDLLCLNLSCFLGSKPRETYFVSLSGTDTWNWIPSQLLFPFYLVISSNYQTCLGLLMHYPLIGDVHSLILKALFLRDPKVSFPGGMRSVKWGEKLACPHDSKDS